MKVAIVDYGSGNLHSAQKAFERAARDNAIAAEILVTSRPEDIHAAERIVLPGVGAFKDCRDGLNAVPGLRPAIEEAVQRQAKPFLGICVGMQLLATRGLEHDVTEGLNWIGGDVKLITPSDPSLKIPHMGWNTLTLHKQHPLFDDITTGDDGSHAYFVHSYHLAAASVDDVLATADYGGPVTATVTRGNIAGVQFHPEKSQSLGLALIANFLRWRP